MSLTKDFIAFVDNGSLVPYFVDGAKYHYKPNIISTQFEYDFKTYYKSYNNYFVGVPFSKFVRPIKASDFNMMKQKYEARHKESLKTTTQLVFSF